MTRRPRPSDASRGRPRDPRRAAGGRLLDRGPARRHHPCQSGAAGQRKPAGYPWAPARDRAV